MERLIQLRIVIKEINNKTLAEKKTLPRNSNFHFSTIQYSFLSLFYV